MMNNSEVAMHLRHVDVTPTAQRITVYDCLKSGEGHPTAEMVYNAARVRVPSISKATVYNALDAFEKAGLVRRLSARSGGARYDVDTSPHPHFICRRCGQLLDIELPCPVRKGDTIVGHRVEEVHTYMYGLCKDCRRESDEGEQE